MDIEKKKSNLSSVSQHLEVSLGEELVVEHS